MGNALALKDRWSSSTSPDNSLLGPQPDSYLEPPPLMHTGNEYADKGTRCDLKDPVHEQLWRHHLDEYCFMAPSQRKDQVHTYQLRVLAARGSYLKALTDAEIDQRLKNTSANTFMFDFLIDLIGGAAILALGNAFKNIRDRGDGATLRGTSDKTIETLVRSVVSSGKRLVPTPRGEAEQERSANLWFLKELTLAVEREFQSLSENLVSKCTDSDLVVLEEAYDVNNGHSSADYQAKIEKLIQRFESSEVGHIGVRWTAGEFGARQEEIKAYWVPLPMGRRLALFKRAHRDGLEAGERDGTMFTGYTHVVTEQESKDRKTEYDRNHPFEFVRFVPADFVEAAVQMHTEKWGSTPTEHEADGSSWVGLARERP